MEKVEILKNQPLTGSTEWLKEALLISKFRFGTTRNGEPCVVFDLYEKVKKDGRKSCKKSIRASLHLCTICNPTQRVGKSTTEL
jgi:hypothetical protein